MRDLVIMLKTKSYWITAAICAAIIAAVMIFIVGNPSFWVFAIAVIGGGAVMPVVLMKGLEMLGPR